MFKEFDDGVNRAQLTIEVDGTPVRVPAGITVAAAVSAHARKTTIRLAPSDGEARAPFCFMGACHECLMEIDGIPNQQACLMEVAEGMQIKRQMATPHAYQEWKENENG